MGLPKIVCGPFKSVCENDMLWDCALKSHISVNKWKSHTSLDQNCTFEDKKTYSLDKVYCEKVMSHQTLFVGL